jgi:hypothetical protein
MVSRTRSVIVAGTSSRSNVTVLSKPNGPAMGPLQSSLLYRCARRYPAVATAASMRSLGRNAIWRRRRSMR